MTWQWVFSLEGEGFVNGFIIAVAALGMLIMLTWKGYFRYWQEWGAIKDHEAKYRGGRSRFGELHKWSAGALVILVIGVIRMIVGMP